MPGPLAVSQKHPETAFAHVRERRIRTNPEDPASKVLLGILSQPAAMQAKITHDVNFSTRHMQFVVGSWSGFK